MIKNIIWDIFISLFYDILFIIIGIELVYIFAMWGVINVSYIWYNSVRYQFYYWYRNAKHEIILYHKSYA